MRKRPQLIQGEQSIQMTSAFRGYNHNDIIGDGEMFDMTNLSGDRYPVLTLRNKRGVTDNNIEGQPVVPLTGIHGRDKLVHVRGTKVYYDLLEVTGLTVNSTSPKKIVSMGAYVCIWPDKVYFNTANMADYGSMEREWTGLGADVDLIMCRADGTDYDMSEIATGTTPPADPVNNQLWLDESGENDVLRQYNSLMDEWVEVPSSYVKVGCTGIGAGLKEYDVIDLAGLEAADGAAPKTAQQIAALNGSKTIYYAGDDYIIIAGLIGQAQEHGQLTGTVTADLKIPDLDFVCESNNRLWGCKYGLVDGEIVNEIRATKLGDFRNWNSFMGLSADSWVGSIGTDGSFTGCITQRGYPVFFKENAIHRVSGSLPSNFSIQTTVARGVQRDCWRSLAVVNENILYKSRNGVMIYDGNMPYSISDQLGGVLYSDARAGVLGDKYYISMMDADENWHMFVYNTKYSNWWKEDAVQALGFGTVDDELFYIDEEHNTLVTVTGSVGTAEGDMDWMAEFGLTGVNYVASSSRDDPRRIRNAKYLSMFKLRMDLAPDAWVRLYIRYDESDTYEYIGQRTGAKMRTHLIPVAPKRCDHLRFKLTGHGGMKLYDLSRIMEVGGDGV